MTTRAYEEEEATPWLVSPLLLVLLVQDVCEVGLSLWCDEELWPDLTGCVDAFGEDEDSSVDFVEPHLVDDRKLLRASKGVHRADTLHVFIEAGGNIPSVGDSKSITHVFEDEEWFALFVGGDADVVAEVVKDGDAVHLLFSFIDA